MICTISHASGLISSTSRVAMPNSCGNDASTMRLKSSLVSPPLNLYIRHIASMQFSPAWTESASFVLSSCRVKYRKLGHFSGKSYDSTFCRTGMSWARICCCEEASIGRRRFRRSSFSSSDILFTVVESSLGCHALLTRFLRYTTAGSPLALVPQTVAGTYKKAVYYCPAQPVICQEGHS